jgi:cytochrome c551/c552
MTKGIKAKSGMMLRGAAAGLLVLAATPLSGQAGDAVKGKALVASSGCFNCHRIGDTGSRLGPNLSDIGDRRTADRLQRSIVAPDEEAGLAQPSLGLRRCQHRRFPRPSPSLPLGLGPRSSGVAGSRSQGIGAINPMECESAPPSRE